jgi:hypothetical protein
MEYCMLCSTNIAIDFSPIFHDRRIHDGFTIFGIHIAEIVPARTSPLRHRIGFSFPDKILAKLYIDPCRNCGKRGLSITGGFVFFDFRKF